MRLRVLLFILQLRNTSMPLCGHNALCGHENIVCNHLNTQTVPNQLSKTLKEAFVFVLINCYGPDIA